MRKANALPEEVKPLRRHCCGDYTCELLILQPRKYGERRSHHHHRKLNGTPPRQTPRIGKQQRQVLRPALPHLRKAAVHSGAECVGPVSYTHLRAHETDSYLVCRLLLEKKKKQ